MSLSKTWFVQATYVLLAIFAVSDAALLGFDIVMRHPVRVSEAFFRASSAKSASLPPSGYYASGERVSIPGAPEKGWAVRYASPECEHCRADEARWSSLRFQLIRKGYRIYEIPPGSSESYPDNAPELAGETQIPFVDVDWMRKYRFTGTPTTLLFNRHGKVIWAQEGEMSQADQKSALLADFWNR